MGAMKVGEASPEGLEEQGQDRRTPAPCAHGGGRGGGRMCRAGHVAFAPEGIPTCLCVPDLASLPVLCVCVCVCGSYFGNSIINISKAERVPSFSSFRTARCTGLCPLSFERRGGRTPGGWMDGRILHLACVSLRLALLLLLSSGRIRILHAPA